MTLSEERTFALAREITERRPDLAPQVARIAKPYAGWDVVAGLTEVLDTIKEQQA